MSRRWGQVSLMFLGTLVALVLAEMLLAWLHPQATWRRLLEGRAKHSSLLPVFETCDYLPFRLRPGAVACMEGIEFRHCWRINSHGFRGPERSLEKRPGELRILALGDSFTAGHGVEVEQAWPGLLEHQSNSAHQQVRVLNAGYACGYSPDCYYAFLHRNLRQLQPDLVIVALFAGNDSCEPFDHFVAEVDEHDLPTRILSLTRYVDETGRRRMCDAARPLAYRYPVLRHSHLWVCAARLLSPVAPVAGFHSPHRRAYSPAMEDAYRRSVDALIGIRRLTAKHHIGLVVAVIPTCFQVDPSVDSWQSASPEYDLQLPQSRWDADLAKTGIVLLDLRAALAEHLRQTKGGIWSLYYRHDRHFTPRGQQVTAQAISRVVAECLAAARS